jgi:DDE domain
LNNIVEQDHRAIKRMTRPMLSFESFWSATVTIAGIEIMYMIRKGQMRSIGMLPGGAILLARGVRNLLARRLAQLLKKFATEPVKLRVDNWEVG